MPVGVPVLGCLAIPHEGLRVVLRHSQAIGVYPAEIVLRRGAPLVGGLAIPHASLRVVLRHSQAVGINHAEVALPVGVPLFGQRTPEPHRRRIIAALIRRIAVLKRSRRCNAKQAEREKATSKDDFDPLFHASPKRCIPRRKALKPMRQHSPAAAIPVNRGAARRRRRARRGRGRAGSSASENRLSRSQSRVRQRLQFAGELLMVTERKA